MRYFRIIVLTSITFILAIFMVSLFHVPGPPARTAKTKVLLKHIYTAMRILEDGNHSPIDEQLRQVSKGSILQEKWAILLNNSTEMLGLEPKNIDKLRHDGFGNLFNVDYKTNLITGSASSALKQTRFDVVVWSSGRNGTNEFGARDDVVLPLPAPTR